MNHDDQISKTIVRLLNQDLKNINQNTATKLQTARSAALEKLESSKNFIHTGKNIAAHEGISWHKNTSLLLFSLILLFLMWLSFSWQVNHDNSETTTTETRLVDDDLTDDTFLDDEFDE
ncbi:DUF3619 family protein [Nitrosomonas aestuarii]|uniref:DUF3619 family protein n=1 Tax=Nitrosomonas aestuarii TaxID=52441 RepID=UPI000D48CF6A|nr:DUF3619 family protein [Nitrosomonas aestuarii]PTN13294.1 uncharacterized protein DUF3619 [Nitrosomonas aestuarii]